MTEAPLLRRLAPSELPAVRREPLDPDTLARAAAIVDDVRERGRRALVEHATRLGDLDEGAEPVLSRRELEAAAHRLADDDRALLERTASRIRAFAAAQREGLHAVEAPIPGGRAGHDVAPVASAGCYAPGGRYPLPSSVLMTVCTARAAGVETVWVASPRPDDVTRAAAAVAGADAMLACGGAQAVGALTHGAGEVPACDAVVGPGSTWVTAAKKHVAGDVRIDMLAGPSELVVLADETADPDLVAADLLAQAEHDEAALPVLVSDASDLADAVERALAEQLRDLPTASTARAALHNGFGVEVNDPFEGARVCDQLAPEHLALHVAEPDTLAERLHHYGALFVGAGAAEVFGDYGAGPNHTLPTGGTARSSGGLWVGTFLRVRTWMRTDDEADAMARDAAALARLEGLEAHARSAERRSGPR